MSTIQTVPYCCNFPLITVEYDDEYRTKRRCTICKKAKYFSKDRGTQTPDGFHGKLQDLKGNGDLYVDCGICQMPVKYSDLFELQKSGTKRESKASQRVTVLVRWEQIEIPYFPKPGSERKDGTLYQGLSQAIRIVNRPILRTLPACFNCWNTFERARPAGRGKLHFIQLQ